MKNIQQMQWIDNFPQCLSYYIQVICNYIWNKFGQKKKRYEGLNELQEEEFNLGLKEQILLNQSNQDQHQNQYYEKQKQQKDAEEVSTKILINQQTEKRQKRKVQQQQQTNPVENSPINQNCKNYDQFKINIDPLSPYYAIIQQKVKNHQQIKQLLKIKGQQINVGLSISNLTIYQIKSQIGLKYIIQYTLPCSYSFYANLQNHINAKSLSPLIQHHILLETVQSNLKIYNLALEKFIMLESRQFTYLKYNYGINNQNWQICVSISPKTIYQKQIQGKQRIQGQLYSVTHVKQFNDTKQVRIQIKSFLQLDLKSIIKNQKVINRGLFEIKNYVNKLYDYCRQYFQEELV